MKTSFTILRDGISSSFQDLGRFNVQYLGIGPSGCMDETNFRLCNAILHNSENEGAIEFAYQGPKIEINENIVKICVTGKVLFNIHKFNGTILPGECYRSYCLEKGDIVDIQNVKDSVYGYLAFEGGILLDSYFESVSTNPRSRIGPNYGEKIKTNNQFSLKTKVNSKEEYILERIPELKNNKIIRVLEGPQIDYFSNEGVKSFFHSPFKITNLTDRMGMRLEGNKIELIKSANIKSEGIIKGSIQIPADGQPIILLADHQTIGGYPKIAVVISADFDDLVQIPSGHTIQFRKVNMREADISYDLKMKTIHNMISTIKKIN